MNRNPQYFAAIDIGSNAIRMVLGHYEQGDLKIVDSWRSFLSLGEAVFQTNQLSSANLEALTHILKEYSELLKNYSNIKMVVAATSAMRTATNQHQVVTHLKKHLGLEVQILSGIQEANCILKATQHCIDWQENLVLLADLGGGSLEISIIEPSGCVLQKSFDHGTRRLATLCVTQQKQMLQLLESFLKKTLASDQTRIAHVILTGGSAKVLAHLYQKEHLLNSHNKRCIAFSWQELMAMKQQILKKGIAHYVNSQQIRSEQADVFFLGLHIFELIGQSVGCEKITIPFVGLKEGLLLQQAQQYFPQCRLLLPSVANSSPP